MVQQQCPAPPRPASPRPSRVPRALASLPEHGTNLRSPAFLSPVTTPTLDWFLCWSVEKKRKKMNKCSHFSVGSYGLVLHYGVNVKMSVRT